MWTCLHITLFSGILLTVEQFTANVSTIELLVWLLAYKQIHHLTLFICTHLKRCILSNHFTTAFYLNVDPVAGGLADQPGVITGIVIGTVLALLNLITFAVIVRYIHSHSKNGKSTCIVYENNHTSDGDLQTEYHQLERPHSYEQPIDLKDLTHPDNQSMTMSQESDRQQFLKRAVRRPLF